MRKKIVCMSMAVILLLGAQATAFAQGNATVNFTEGNTLEYTNVSDNGDGSVSLGNEFTGIAPGETKTQTVTITNTNSKTVDFYMNAEAIKALEDVSNDAKGAGYEVKLSAGSNVLYDSTVGGYGAADAEGSTQGLSEVKALEDYVLIATLAQGGSRNVTLQIYFDGEGMDNQAQAVDYSNTLGKFKFQFKAGYQDPATPEKIYKVVTKKGETKYVKKLVEIIEDAVPLAAVAVPTSDKAMIGAGIAVLALGIILVVTVTGKRKRKEQP